MNAPKTPAPRRASLFALVILIPLALAAVVCGFFLSSSLAAWLFSSALALTGVGLFAAVGMPAVLSLGHNPRFFLKSLIAINAIAIVGTILLFPDGVRQAVRANGAWPVRAVARYLPPQQKDTVTKEATELAARLAEELPSGPGALSYFLPKLEPQAQPTPKGVIKSSKGKTSSKSGATDSATVKFHKDGSSMIVQVSLNGKVSVPLIYDTGASITTIDDATAAKLGISLKGARTIDVETANGLSKQPLVSLSSIDVGGARVQGPIDVAICHACSLSGADGLLGLNFSSAFVTQIDPQAGTITFLPKK